MDYLELETLKQTREYKAAEALTNAVNTMGWKPKKFAMGMSVQHRTLQQEVMRTFVAMIHVMASDDYGYDDRNRGSHEAAKKMVESGILDEIYLPFILSMYLESTCVGIGMNRWNRLMKGAKPLNYDWLVRRIKKHLPDMYEALGLDFYNPYEEQTRVTRTHYILVHSSIEYFIHK